MSFELLDTESEAHNSDRDEEGRRKYSSYVQRFIQPGEEISEECREHLARKPVFLPRSIRSYNNSPYGKLREAPMENHFKTEENGVSKESSETSPNGKNDKVNDKHDNSIVNQDNLQCKFNPRNFKILYVIDSETCFYRKLALTRAKNSHKAVSRRKVSDFGRWHSKWLKSNVSDTSQTSINEWFMGKCEGLVPNRTHKITKNNLESTPFRTYYKYKAEIIKTNFTEKNGKQTTTTVQQPNNAPAGAAAAASLTSATSGTS
jgi:paired amphipathic helix protein Sin3a